YTWCKAPRLDGRVVEVGALARQVVDGHPLARDLVARGGGNVLSRVTGRLLELARMVPQMERWVTALAPGEPFCVTGGLPEDAMGMGLVEAARGGLGHWIEVRGGRIQGYQIIAPTTWNFSPRDAEGRPGPLEQALTGLPSGDDESAVLVQHVVRSFDPCMVCTVH
ncbi:MAG TPA: nickel-dependent hydrogenase large subunit, partial [Anaeromyxobacteraceae bacterium]|nr:nickel-dependent hydrogenase large subunit [Anaeromyxobacteraceae bacterium]